MKHLLYILICLNSLLAFSQEEKRLALVIGNSDYKKGALKNPANDAMNYVKDDVLKKEIQKSILEKCKD